MSDCSCHKKSHGHKSSKESKELDWKNLILWGAIGILAIVVLFTVFSGGGTSSSTIPVAQAAGQVAKSSGGMVGGC